MKLKTVLFSINLFFVFTVRPTEKSLAKVPSQSTQCKAQKLELSSFSPLSKPVVQTPLAKNTCPPCFDQKELFNKIRSLFKDQEKNLQSYWSDIKTTFTPLQPSLEEQKKEFEEQARQLRLEKFNTFSNTASDCFDGASTLIYTFGNPQTAAKIQNFGAASLKIASSMNGIIEGGAAVGGASLINPYVGLAMGVCSLIGLFQDHEENNGLEVLMEAMQHYTMALSRQMHEQFEFTMQRFDGIENKIDHYGMAMLHEFFALHQKQDYSLEKLFELRKDFMEKSLLLQGSIGFVNESLALKYCSLTANLEALRTEKINEIVHIALHDSTKENLPLKKFDKHLDKLYTKASVRAKEAHVTGGAIDVTNYEAVSQMLTSRTDTSTDSLHHPAYNSLNLIRGYLNRHCKEDHNQPLANPLIWIQCSDAIITMLQKRLGKANDYPSSQNHKELAITMLKKLHDEGTSISNFIRSVYDNNTVEKVAQQYEQTVQEVTTIFEKILANFEHEKTKQLQDQYQTLCASESSHISLSAQNLDYESQKQKIRAMYAYPLSEIDRGGDFYKTQRSFYPLSEIDRGGDFYKTRCSFTYQGKNITGTFTSHLSIMMCTYTENNDWSFCNSLLRRSAETYEITARECTQYKINQSLAAVKPIDQEKSALTFKLFELPQKPPISHPLSRVMHQSGNHVYQLPVLPLPKSYTIPSYYLIQEQLGRGELRHEYSYDDKNWYINSYFISNQGAQTLIASSQAKLDSTQSPLAPYDHAFNNWYGGYFAKKNDLLQYSGLDFSESAFSWSGHIPPLKPYEGLSDTWHTTAQTVSLDNKTNNESIECANATLKREFNNKLIEQLVPGTILYATIKKLDAQCKMIDSLLALGYSQDYERIPWRKSNLFLHLIDEQSIRNYLKQYSNPQSNDSKNNVHFPHHLKITSEVVTMLLSNIKNIPYKVLPDLQDTLNRLNTTLRMVELKTVTPKTLSYDAHDLLKEKIQEIEQLRTEVQQSRNEVKELTEKVNMLLALLSPNNK